MDEKKQEIIKKIESMEDNDPYMVTITYLDKEGNHDFQTSVYSDLPIEQYDISKEVISELVDEQKNEKVRRLIDASR